MTQWRSEIMNLTFWFDEVKNTKKFLKFLFLVLILMSMEHVFFEASTIVDKDKQCREMNLCYWGGNVETATKHTAQQVSMIQFRSQ